MSPATPTPSAVGLILGGWLTDLNGIFGMDIEGWRITLLITTPIGIAAALLAPRASCASPSRTLVSWTCPAP